MSRGRERAPLFGVSEGNHHHHLSSSNNKNNISHLGTDPESLERSNDAEISRMGERVDLLKNITRGIHGEVDRQNSNLDGLDMSFAGARAQINGTVERLGRVMGKNAASRPCLTVAVIVIVLLLLLKTIG